MIKNNLNYFFFLLLLSLILFLPNEVFSGENINFLSLKKNEVNLRQGPSFEYPVILTYKKKNLPVIILDKSDAWKKIKDFENNSGWIHISQLSKRKSAININNNVIVYKKPTIYSKPIVKLESGRLVLIKKCKIDWCKIKTGKYNGWIFKNSLWGKIN